MVLEIAVYSPEAAIIAQRAGADRIELCSAPAEGGLTPGAGVMKLVRRELLIPIHVMIRPREGDFCYSDVEFRAMLLEIEEAGKAGIDGIVCGILTKEGVVDEPRLKILVDAAKPMNVTFHRAFDMSKKPEESLETLINCGISRVLTSGGKQTALQGIEMIRNLVKLSAGRIIIMPGSGINELNINELTQIESIQEIHLSAKTYFKGAMKYRNPEIAMGDNIRIPEYELLLPDAGIIRRIQGIIRTN